ncbi:MAG: valine--tRNA ligase [Candidatus Vogelbacteria bacterium]|nr:valine--tRNA ligase [Candidatus Vogelbacteria bacterium]
MANVPDKLTKPYDPAQTEGRIYKEWEDGNHFAPQGKGESFTIIMPPPNANGDLHAGHALFITLEDIMTRYARMQGKRALWVPGADHAGFETQIVYEKKLEKEGRSRFKMSREELYQEILAFTLENKTNMEAQVRRLGASCDWSREKFTLDPEVVAEVGRTFKKMFDDDLIYRGERIVNWCSKHGTSLSDVETEFVEQVDPLYYLQYGPFVIATTRPETKFGDKYVVTHPDDERYANYTHGQQLELEWINGPITATVIKDDVIDMNFGTGVMTITPWHDATDFEIAKRHNLSKEQIIDEHGKLLPVAGDLAGLKIKEARAKIMEKLQAKGLIVKVEDKYNHAVKTCYKCGTAIEPQIRDQWFVKMKPLADQAVKAVNDCQIKFIPDNQRKIFLYWMENTIDWNISRQIVWGIPIPAKICDACRSGMPDLENKITTCPSCSGPMRTDTDTFDTWFSSGQWPQLVLGYPDHADFKTFYPTSVMETGHDLIFKWVPRMVIFGLYLTGQVPFHTVYLHGLVNDAKGQKMSKSKGNVVSPEELINEFGTDALRMALVVGNTPGTDLALARDKVKAYKHFANKLWNVARFIITELEQNKDWVKTDLTEIDHLLLKQFEAVIKEVTGDLEHYRFHLAAEKLYHYIWHELADVLIEESKIILKTDAANSRRQLLFKILDGSLRTLHPFMPFITEEVWSLLTPHHSNHQLLIITPWPLSSNL